MEFGRGIDECKESKMYKNIEMGATSKRTPLAAQTSITTPASSQAERKNEITTDDVLRVVERLDPVEMARFEQDLLQYGRQGARSRFLLDVLAIAADEKEERSRDVAA